MTELGTQNTSRKKNYVQLQVFSYKSIFIEIYKRYKVTTVTQEWTFGTYTE